MISRMLVIMRVRLVTMIVMAVRIVSVRLVVVMGRLAMMPGIVGVHLVGMHGGGFGLIGLGGECGIGGCVLDDFALDAVAMAAAAGIAVARTAAVAVGGAVLALFLGLAMGLLLGFDQCLPVGNRDLVVVGMDFAEGEEAVAVAAIFDESGLERGFDSCDLGEVDITAQLLAVGGLEIKFLDAIAADHDNPGLFRVGSIDQHFVGHFATHDGGGRV